jgi:hypothetical protein
MASQADAASESDDSLMAYEHDRAFYRLQYPPQAAPTFVSDGVSHRVVDIGEGGFRYATSNQAVPLAGAKLIGVLRFENEDDVEVDGTVVRFQSGEVAVHCGAHPIPLGLVLREQRRLRQRFPFRA